MPTLTTPMSITVNSTNGRVINVGRRLSSTIFSNDGQSSVTAKMPNLQNLHSAIESSLNASEPVVTFTVRGIESITVNHQGRETVVELPTEYAFNFEVFVSERVGRRRTPIYRTRPRERDNALTTPSLTVIEHSVLSDALNGMISNRLANSNVATISNPNRLSVFEEQRSDLALLINNLNEPSSEYNAIVDWNSALTWQRSTESNTQEEAPDFDSNTGMNPVIIEQETPAQRVLDRNGMVRVVAPVSNGNTTMNTLDFAQDFDSFKSIYRECALNENGVTHPVLLPMIEGEIDSYGITRGNKSRTFGIEIEIDFPEESERNIGESKRLLHERLVAANLAFDIPMRSNNWHVAQRRENPDGSVGYSDARNGWSVEFDRTVDDYDGLRGCELVSPVLYNTPETWADIEEVINILNELGAKTNVKHGLHVNISTRGMDEESVVRLIKLNNAFEDVLYRLAHTDEIGNTHRGRSYCTPIQPHHAETYESLHYANQHRSIINLAASEAHLSERRRRSSARLEFRMFDGTLNAGRIQANVTLAFAMVRWAIAQDITPELPRYEIGHHVLQRGTTVRQGRVQRATARRLTGDAWKESTLAFREMLDMLALSPEQNKQLITIYKASRWMI